MGTDQCPLFGVERCPLLGCSKCISSMVKSIGGKWAVRSTEVVRFSEGPLLEVSLYYVNDHAEISEDAYGRRVVYSVLYLQLQTSYRLLVKDVGVP